MLNVNRLPFRHVKTTQRFAVLYKKSDFGDFLCVNIKALTFNLPRADPHSLVSTRLRKLYQILMHDHHNSDQHFDKAKP